MTDELTEADYVYHAVQKGVDMKIGLDIASLAYKKLVSKIILIAGDSDFVPASKVTIPPLVEVEKNQAGNN